jgi:chemotaxis protein histidine kinase CheA
MTFAKNITGPNKPSVASAEMDSKTSSTSIPRGSTASQMDKPKQQSRIQTQQQHIQQIEQQFEPKETKQQQEQQYTQQRQVEERPTEARQIEARRTQPQVEKPQQKTQQQNLSKETKAKQETQKQKPSQVEKPQKKTQQQNPSQDAGQDTQQKNSPKKEDKETQQNQPKEAPSAPVIDTSGIKSGYVGVKYKKPDNKRYKVLIEKDGKRYAYDLTANGSLEKFPLQMGDGKYIIRVMEHVEGTQYRTISSKTIEVKTSGKYDAYLASVKMIRWNNSMSAIKTAKQLAGNSSSDMDKVKKIYNYVVSKIRYDADKLGKLPSNYVPDIEKTFKTRKGICYDFSSLFAGMLRSVGIPAKLVKGYASGVEGYHAWNEVYIESKGKWIVIDTSYDAQMRAAGKKTSMTKNKGDYSKKKEY